jgi:hypothetical protein
MEGIRRQAQEVAQDEFHALVRDMVAHPGTVDKGLAARYRAAERVVDAIDAYQRIAQATDPEAPKVTDVRGRPVSVEEWTEADKRWAWGDR